MPQSHPFNAVTTGGKNIHKQIAELVGKLSALRWATTDPTEREGIDYLMKLLNKQSLALLAAELDTNSSSLKKASAQLAEAAKSAQDSLDQLNKIAETLAKVAQAVKLIDEVLGIVGPFLL